MKKRKAIQAMLLVAALLASLAFSPNEKAEAKKKYTVEKCMRTIQSGKNYQMSKIVKDAMGSEWDKKVFKKTKWKSDSSRLKIKGKKIVAKKSGDYRLTGTYKNTKYVMILRVVDENWKKVPEDIAFIKIQHMSEVKQLADTSTVAEVCRRLNQAQYKFNYNQTNSRLVGWTYRIFLCHADGTVERDFTIRTNGVTDSSIWYNCKDDGNLYNDIENLYNSIELSGHL